MTHTFRDKDIDEIFVIKSPKNTLLDISYLGPTEDMFYTGKALQMLLDIIDGYDEGGCDSIRYKTYRDLIRNEF